MASKGKLDEVDRRILRDLQADGRITNVDLAKGIGISAPPCLRRVRALEEKEIIRGYHADIQAEALGYGDGFCFCRAAFSGRKRSSEV